MKGDFSRRFGLPVDNFAGVLWQQGRILSDSDGNAVTRLATAWQERAGRDVIGGGVAAVPAGEGDSFRVTEAALSGGRVTLTLDPGHLWADGWLLRLDEEPPVTREATYFDAPLNDPPVDEDRIAAGVRDLVVLESWREAMSGFQDPEALIEPALGGPDTTERLLNSYRLRLLRLDPGETCETAAERLYDDLAGLGRLIATLDPPSETTGDCPMPDAGGYTGFEHRLFRVEIAETDSPEAHFKWSDMNGGLVGRGTFDAGAGIASITANLAAIRSAGRDSFYLEALAYDEALGHWRVTYGAEVTLNADNEIVLPAAASFGAVPASGERVFFRLWNALEPIAAYPISASPTLLVDGIHLQFDPDLAHRPGDYWVFQVRAGEVSNPETLVDDEAPHGIDTRRVPLAVLEWDGSGAISAAADEIHDCRRRFPPLTRRDSCCTFSVGDGHNSHGDYDSIQEAVDALPEDGGRVCVLPGEHEAAVVIGDRRNVTIHGCGLLSRVTGLPPDEGAIEAAPVFHVLDSQNVTITGLGVISDPDGIGVLVESSPQSPDLDISSEATLIVELSDLGVLGGPRSAIEVREADQVTIRDCLVLLRDQPTTWPGIFFMGEDGLIERNQIRVLASPDGGDQTPGLAPAAPSAGAALGGIQLAGLSARVRVAHNLIQGGNGNGITLGSIVEFDDDGLEIQVFYGWVINVNDPCFPCAPGDSFIPRRPGGEGEDGEGPRIEPAGPLEDIKIEENRILDMGLNGIGVIGFFDLSALDLFISVEGLEILGNEIRGCLQRRIAPIPESMQNAMGYGGIALADVERLAIRDNVIEDNGPDHLQPVNGIFVLHGEGIDISRNRVLNNGAKTTEPARDAAAGRRGGVSIVYAVAPMVPVLIGRSFFPRQDGTPALIMQENVVTAPLGRALTLVAYGPVIVQGNALTSRGMILPRGDLLDSTFLASSVLIANLGVSNELYGQVLLYALLNQGRVKPGGRANVDFTDDFTIRRTSRPGLDDLWFGQYLANGNVSFTDNQVVCDMLETGLSFSLFSIVILSLDDIAFNDNQCDASLLDDFLLSQAMLFGFSLRCSNNRFKEGILNALFSAITFGLFNTTTGNQSTHCLLVRPSSPPHPLTVRSDNRALIDAFFQSFCARVDRMLLRFGNFRLGGGEADPGGTDGQGKEGG